VEVRKRAPSTPASRSNTNTAPSAPMLDAPARAAIKESIKVNTNDPSVDVDPALLNRLSPSVRDVAEHAAMLKSVLSRLGPIYDLIEREASRIAETASVVLGDSEFDWDKADADGPPPLNPRSQPQAEPQPSRLGSPTIEEVPLAGFNGMSDGDGKGVGIDMGGLVAEMEEQLRGGGGGEPEGEGDPKDLNEMESFLADAVSPDSESDQEGYQGGDVGTYVGGEM